VVHDVSLHEQGGLRNASGRERQSARLPTAREDLSFRDSGWDRWQADGSIALVDTKWGGSGEPVRFQGKYRMSFLGGALQGYETFPLSLGWAWSTHPWQATK
jgi:hypothetical protein